MNQSNKLSTDEMCIVIFVSSLIGYIVANILFAIIILGIPFILTLCWNYIIRIFSFNLPQITFIQTFIVCTLSMILYNLVVKE